MVNPPQSGLDNLAPTEALKTTSVYKPSVITNAKGFDTPGLVRVQSARYGNLQTGILSKTRCFGKNIQTKKGEKGEKYDSDSDDDADPSVRRAALGEFRRRYNYSAPMRRHPSDRMYARFAKQYEKRLLPRFNLKDVVVVLDQEMTVF